VFKNHGLPDEIPEKIMPAGREEAWLPRLLLDAGLVKSTSEARRLIKQKAVSLDGEKILDEGLNVRTAGSILLQVGKRRYCRIVFK